MITVFLALCAAASNAVASVLQRRAARAIPDSEAMRPALLLTLVRNPVWLGGILALTGGFLLQAAALSTGGLALVQPVLVAELPFTMLILARMFHTRLGGESWLALIALSGGLALLLFAAAPGEGHEHPGAGGWLVAGLATAGVITGLVVVATLTSGAARAAVFGVAGGFGFSLTAALMKEATYLLPAGPQALFTAWPLYAMVVAGLGSLFLLQNSLQSGTLVAAQPALTVSDPVASIIFGVTLFDEHVRTGGWSVLQFVGVGLLGYGSIRLAKSPPIRRQLDDVTPAPSRGRPRPAPR